MGGCCSKCDKYLVGDPKLVKGGDTPKLERVSPRTNFNTVEKNDCKDVSGTGIKTGTFVSSTVQQTSNDVEKTNGVSHGELGNKSEILKTRPHESPTNNQLNQDGDRSHSPAGTDTDIADSIPAKEYSEAKKPAMVSHLAPTSLGKNKDSTAQSAMMIETPPPKVDVSEFVSSAKYQTPQLMTESVQSNCSMNSTALSGTGVEVDDSKSVTTIDTVNNSIEVTNSAKSVGKVCFKDTIKEEACVVETSSKSVELICANEDVKSSIHQSQEKKDETLTQEITNSQVESMFSSKSEETTMMQSSIVEQSSTTVSESLAKFRQTSTSTEQSNSNTEHKQSSMVVVESASIEQSSSAVESVDIKESFNVKGCSKVTESTTSHTAAIESVSSQAEMRAESSVVDLSKSTAQSTSSVTEVSNFTKTTVSSIQPASHIESKGILESSSLVEQSIVNECSVVNTTGCHRVEVASSSDCETASASTSTSVPEDQLKGGEIDTVTSNSNSHKTSMHSSEVVEKACTTIVTTKDGEEPVTKVEQLTSVQSAKAASEIHQDQGQIVSIVELADTNKQEKAVTALGQGNQMTENSSVYSESAGVAIKDGQVQSSHKTSSFTENNDLPSKIQVPDLLDLDEDLPPPPACDDFPPPPPIENDDPPPPPLSSSAMCEYALESRSSSSAMCEYPSESRSSYVTLVTPTGFVSPSRDENDANRRTFANSLLAGQNDDMEDKKEQPPHLAGQERE